MTVDKENAGGIVVIDWEEDDREVSLDLGLTDSQNPFNWSKARKYVMVVCACSISALTAINATSMSIMSIWGPAWFGCSREMFILGLTIYNLSVAVTPLILAPLSEHLGRNEIYQVTCFM